MIRALLILLALLGMPAAVFAHEGHGEEGAAPWDIATKWPDRIIATLPGDPATSFAVTWRTEASVDEAVAQIATGIEDSRFDTRATTHNSSVEFLDREAVYAGHGKVPGNVGRGPVTYHSVIFTDLTPDTLYAYRVRGARGHWSEWLHFRTAPREGPVSFLYFGDAQRGVHSHWSRMIRAGFEAAPNARFLLHAGDLVNRAGRDTEWAEWFAAGSFIHATRASIPVTGNHEYIGTEHGGVNDGAAILSEHWRPQFTLPVVADLPEALHETVYDVRYSADLHIFVLDSSSPLWGEQLTWLEQSAGASDARWKIVSFHHSPFRPGIRNKPEELAKREAFLEVAGTTGIAMVLAGHNHSYTRASYGEGLLAKSAPGDPRALELVVIVSVSGGMSGRENGEGYRRGNAAIADRLKLDRAANYTPTFQVIDIDGDRLSFATHTAAGNIYDAFTLRRSEGGVMQIIDGEEAFTPERELEDFRANYPGHNDLR